MMSEPHAPSSWQPVSAEECGDWFDSDGRLVKEITMRQRVFEVGVHPLCRRRLWKFLFDIYPMTSTYREQKTIDIENRSQYQALCQRWEVLDKAIQVPDDDLSDSPPYMELSDDEDDSNYCPAGSHLCPRNHVRQGSKVAPKRASQPVSVEYCHSCSNGSPELRAKSHSVDVARSASSNALINREKDVTMVTDHMTDGACTAQGTNVHTATDTSGGSHASLCDEEPEQDRQPQCHCDFRRHSWEEVLDEEGRALLNILEFPSKVFAARQPLELEKSYAKAKRIILRDVLRTDRNYHYFSHKRNLRKVHRILLIFAMFHPETGYAQGMNDLLARFLVVTNSEVDAYWMFVHYMEDKRLDFLEQSMMRKVALVKKLISEIDQGLYQFFERSECHDYLFCHRWLLLDFKREFNFEDSLRIFEVLGTHYLELYSDKAQVETDKAIAKEFLNEGGEMRPGRGMMNFEFTFDLFVSAAILIMHRDQICQATDAASVYGCLNGLSMNMELSSVLAQAVELCLKYCRQSVCRGFSEVDI